VASWPALTLAQVSWTASAPPTPRATRTTVTDSAGAAVTAASRLHRGCCDILSWPVVTPMRNRLVRTVFVPVIVGETRGACCWRPSWRPPPCRRLPRRRPHVAPPSTTSCCTMRWSPHLRAQKLRLPLCPIFGSASLGTVGWPVPRWSSWPSACATPRRQRRRSALPPPPPGPPPPPPPHRTAARRPASARSPDWRRTRGAARRDEGATARQPRRR